MARWSLSQRVFCKLGRYMDDDPYYCWCGCSSSWWNLRRLFRKFVLRKSAGGNVEVIDMYRGSR